MTKRKCAEYMDGIQGRMHGGPFKNFEDILLIAPPISFSSLLFLFSYPAFLLFPPVVCASGADATRRSAMSGADRIAARGKRDAVTRNAIAGHEHGHRGGACTCYGDCGAAPFHSAWIRLLCGSSELA